MRAHTMVVRESVGHSVRVRLRVRVRSGVYVVCVCVPSLDLGFRVSGLGLLVSGFGFRV